MKTMFLLAVAVSLVSVVACSSDDDATPAAPSAAGAGGAEAGAGGSTAGSAGAAGADGGGAGTQAQAQAQGGSAGSSAGAAGSSGSSSGELEMVSFDSFCTGTLLEDLPLYYAAFYQEGFYREGDPGPIAPAGTVFWIGYGSFSSTLKGYFILPDGQLALLRDRPSLVGGADFRWIHGGSMSFVPHLPLPIFAVGSRSAGSDHGPSGMRSTHARRPRHGATVRDVPRKDRHDPSYRPAA
jgi:hypothetical protein